ncbi:hypothetical protein C8J56DRAFT_981737 [Mycena floridula]|nr:hypothetical protein C8J56DRAFT_981737 [Mycena floridula]
MDTKKGILALAEFIEKSDAFTKTGKPRKDRDMPTLEEEPDPVEGDEPKDNDPGAPSPRPTRLRAPLSTYKRR